jgi:hypothetical protein
MKTMKKNLLILGAIFEFRYTLNEMGCCVVLRYRFPICFLGFLFMGEASFIFFGRPHTLSFSFHMGVRVQRGVLAFVSNCLFPHFPVAGLICEEQEWGRVDIIRIVRNYLYHAWNRCKYI